MRESAGGRGNQIRSWRMVLGSELPQLVLVVDCQATAAAPRSTLDESRPASALRWV
jgi:hypothetical protein